ncbi:MAG: CDP-alcohol phosphatidyltransferase family protein [Actinomycetota bacterium]
MFDGNFRAGFERAVAPMGRGLHAIGVSPDAVTATGVAMAAGCAVAIAFGQFPLAFLLLCATGIPDALDGAVAKAGGRAGPRGAYLDSVSDRLSDALLFFGAAWYFVRVDRPEMALLPFGLYIAASLVSYQRAKAESLGYQAKGGLMERAERFIALGIGLALQPLWAPIFEIVLWVMFALTVITVITRFVKVWRQATDALPPAVRRSPARRRRAARASGERRRGRYRVGARRPPSAR